MQRRSFIKGSMLLGGQLLAGFTVVSRSWLAQAQTATNWPLQDLQTKLGADGLFVTQANNAPQFNSYLTAFNTRTQLPPQVRVMCKTAVGVAAAVNWARDNNIPFAVRCGGHSYEGFSQSTQLVIDLRLMNNVQLDANNQLVEIAGGSSLWAAYQVVGKQNLALAAGSCPSVGAGGHITGGGHGHLARAYGLTCDNLVEVDVVTADGNLVTANITQNPDLFWACRGGGGGSFGIATRFQLQTLPVNTATVFKITWTKPLAQAVELFAAWQSWAPTAPNSMAAFLSLTYQGDGNFRVHCAGQTTDNGLTIPTQLQPMTRLVMADDPGLQRDTMSFLNSVIYYAGGLKATTTYPSYPMKGKSDYVVAPLNTDGISALFKGLQVMPPNAVSLSLDAYGGAINNLAATDTAFVHRQGTLYCIQYGAMLPNSNQATQRLSQMQTYYQSLRPFMSGGAYVNYSDLDLGTIADANPAYLNAYWGRNLPRLQEIKAKYDPQNLFNHAQSIKPAVS